MESTLLKLCSGDLDPLIQFEPKDPEYWKHFNKIDKILEKCTEIIGYKNIKLLDDMMDIYIIMAEIEKKEMFELGFSIAVKIMAEVYSEKRTV